MPRSGILGIPRYTVSLRGSFPPNFRLATGSRVALEPGPPISCSMAEHPLSIVALDDDEDFRHYIRSILEGEGHDARVASNSRELLEMCEDALPDVVLLDVKMGPESGEQVLAEIRKLWPKLCVIVVTGYPTLDTMRSMFKQNVYDYLAKPFSITELQRVLHQASDAFNLGTQPQDRLRRELGRQIRLARTQRGWTLRELSDAAGVSVSQVSSIERGTHLPSIESLLSIAAALDEKPSAWFSSAGL